jgi:hypothetical protein
MSDEKSPLLSKAGKADKFTLVIHGGAGTMDRARSTPEQRARYRRVLEQALRAGHAVLAGGGEAMDAAVAAVSVLEGSGACAIAARMRVLIRPRLPALQLGQGRRVQRRRQGTRYLL